MGRFHSLHWGVMHSSLTRLGLQEYAKQMQSSCKRNAKRNPCASERMPIPLHRRLRQMSNPLNNQKRMKKLIIMAIALACAMQVNAQTKMDDKEIIGTWIMESMQWEGEKKMECGKTTGYSQFKFYGADGEYACAEIALTKDGQVRVMPHEYGKYTLKDGWYSEMGRPAVKDAIVWVDKTTTKGTWQKRHDIWKKKTLPTKMVKYIVECCKTKETPTDIQQIIKQSLFE